MPRLRGTVRATGIVVGVTIAVVVAAGAFLTISHSRSASQQQRFVVSNYETISKMREAMIVLQDAEVGQRAYLLTGDTADLASYERARPRIDTSLRQLEAATAGEADALNQIAEFRDATNKKFEELNASVVAYQLYGRRTTAPQGAERRTTDRLRGVADSFVEVQRRQLARRLALLRSEQEQADIAGLLVLGCAFFCLIAGTFVIVRGSERLEDVQDQLAARTHLLQSTLETLQDPIFVLDAQGTVVAWNEAFVQLASWDQTRNPVLRRDYLLSPRSPGMQAMLAPLRLDDDVADPVLTARASFDGRDYEVSRGKMGSGGAVIRSVDVTEKLRDEAALRQGQKMEAVGQLTGGMAHDFNNILQIVQANLDLVRTEVSDNASAVARLHSASAAADRGARLTQQLLAFSRRQPLAPRPTSIARLVTDLTGLLKNALGERLTLELDAAADAWNAAIDPGQLENAILNLALNARDAMAGGGAVRVEVSNATLDRRYAALHPDVNPGAYVLVAVSDTGTGMPAEVVAHAFDPFFTTKQEGKGTGLGLSMVYGFVRQSNGHIRIDSAIGQGTSVKLFLPRTLDPVAEPEAPPSGVAAGDERILVVEDNDDVRRAVVDMLSGWGYRVTAAENPDVAVGLIEKNSNFDMLFTDVVMPGAVSVVELIAMVQRLRPSMAILLTSGYARDLIPQQYREDLPMIAKPYRSDDLSARIRAVLSLRRAPAMKSEPAHVPAAVSGDGRPKRILLVEDEVVLRMSTTDMLERLDCFVSGVGSGEQALEMLSRGAAFDLLLTDLGLPGMSGEELAVEVRARFPGLPVVIASGYGRSPSKTEGVNFISKPYSSIDLQQALDHAARTAVAPLHLLPI